MTLNQPDAMVETTIPPATNPVPWQTPATVGSLPASAVDSPEDPIAALPPPNALRQTKLIFTLGPTLESAPLLRAMLEAGVSAFRLNPRLIDHDRALKAVYAIRSISTELERPVALLLDLPASTGGPDAVAFSEDELADIRFGLDCGVDWIAVPAGRDGTLVRQIRQLLSEAKRSAIGVPARIDRGATSAALDESLALSDGLVLGSASDPANPLAARKCAVAGKLAVIPVDAHSEVPDALSAHPDALLFTEAGGVNATSPDALRELEGLILRLEMARPAAEPDAHLPGTEAEDAIIQTMRKAMEAGAEAIVLLTRSGPAAIRCAACRPRTARVVVCTPDVRLARRLGLHYALESAVLPFGAGTRISFTAAEKSLRARGLVARGAKVAFLVDSLDSAAGPSLAQIRTMP